MKNVTFPLQKNIYDISMTYKIMYDIMLCEKKIKIIKHQMYLLKNIPDIVSERSTSFISNCKYNFLL